MHKHQVWHAGGVPKTIQVRNVPDKLYREVALRAKAAGVTLTDYVRRLLEREVGRPPAEEVFGRIAKRPPVDLRLSAELLGEERRKRSGS